MFLSKSISEVIFFRIVQELTIESCNDLFVGGTWQALSTLANLTRLELARLRKSILSHPTGFLR